MPILRTLVTGLRQAPGYTLMRALGRFKALRTVVPATVRLAHLSQYHEHQAMLARDMSSSPFSAQASPQFIEQMRGLGIAHGLMLDPAIVRSVRGYAEAAPCYADRDERHGFHNSKHAQACGSLGKNILVAQYFNTAENCPAIGALCTDPALRWIAGAYLGAPPRLVGVNLWWTYPVAASDADRDRHAHLFHRDVDDFRFIKFFFYLTDVSSDDGAHVCVPGSQLAPPRRNFLDRWQIRRYTDAEIEQCYGKNAPQVICGPAGTGFAEDTLCIHRGSTPVRNPRLLLQLQFALFDYGTLHDRRDPRKLHMLNTQDAVADASA